MGKVRYADRAMLIDSPYEPGPVELRTLAADYHSRANSADPVVARLLVEIAEELEVEAHELERRPRLILSRVPGTA